MDATTTEPSATTKDPERLRKLWPDSVIAHGYAAIPNMLLWAQARLKIEPEEMNVLVQIIGFRWTAGSHPWVTKKVLATRIGRGERTIQRYLTQLEDKGLVTRVTRTRVTRGQDANGYDVSGLIKALAALAPEFKKVTDQNKLRRRRAEGASG